MSDQADILRGHQLRVTLARAKILKVIQEEGVLPSARDIMRKLESRGEGVGLSTIFSALARFRQAGLLEGYGGDEADRR